MVIPEGQKKRETIGKKKKKQATQEVWVCKITVQGLTAFFRSRYFVFLVTGIPDRKAKMSLFAWKSQTDKNSSLWHQDKNLHEKKKKCVTWDKIVSKHLDQSPVNGFWFLPDLITAVWTSPLRKEKEKKNTQLPYWVSNLEISLPITAWEFGNFSLIPAAVLSKCWSLLYITV